MYGMYIKLDLVNDLKRRGFFDRIYSFVPTHMLEVTLEV